MPALSLRPPLPFPTRLRPWRAVGLGAMLLGCADADPPPRPEVGEPVVGAADSVAPESPRLTPAESAAAVVRIQAHADSVTRAIRGADGVSTPRVSTPPPALSPDEEYRRCMEQARPVEPPMRDHIERACRNRRAARQGE